MSDKSRRIEERNDIIRRITNLQQAKVSIENECEELQRRLSNLDIGPPVEHISAQTSVPSTAATKTPRTYSFARHSVIERDSSFDRVSGKSAAPLTHGIENFDRSPPFTKGDILRITNRRNNDFGKAGVWDKQSPTFIYFSNDKNNWHRAPHNLERIHISEYSP